MYSKFILLTSVFTEFKDKVKKLLEVFGWC